MDNESRALLGETALEAFIDASEAWGEPDKTCLQDLLTDLMHYADCAGIDWCAVLRMATEHYEEEK